MTHFEKTTLERPAVPCSAWHLTLSGRCLNCGYDPLVHDVRKTEEATCTSAR